MNGDVALEVVPLVTPPEEEQRLPGTEAEAEVRSKCDRDVDVEDPLLDALVRILGGDEESEDDGESHQPRSEHGKAGKAADGGGCQRLLTR